MTSYERGFRNGRAFRREVDRTGGLIVAQYVAAQEAVASYRGIRPMSDALTRAMRNARAYDVGYLRGLRT